MYEITIKNLDLEQIACSGQCFRMRRLEGNTWAVLAGEDYIQVRQQGERFVFCCGEEEFIRVWSPYFDQDRDYGRIRDMADAGDAYLRSAMEFGWGVRILRQDAWEMILTFLISQNNNITRITNSVEALCRRFGKRKKAYEGLSPDPALENGCFYGFPSPEAMEVSAVGDFAGLGLGYRDKYLCSMVRRCRGEEGRAWLNTLKAADYDRAMELLKKEPGIGQKVAQCICLFGLHQVEAFPIDTHIRQILQAHYPEGFPHERYQGAAGIIQQYLFYYKLRREK